MNNLRGLVLGRGCKVGTYGYTLRPIYMIRLSYTIRILVKSHEVSIPVDYIRTTFKIYCLQACTLVDSISCTPELRILYDNHIVYVDLWWSRLSKSKVLKKCFMPMQTYIHSNKFKHLCTCSFGQ